MKFASKISIITVIATLSTMAGSAASAQQQPREMSPLLRAEALRQAGERFDAADKNHDRRLSAEEARAGRPEGRPGKGQGTGQQQRPAPQPQGEFKPISRAEAIKREAEQFDAADKNGDGVLGVAEMREMRSPRR